MKNVKKVMPIMAFVLAVGLAFANKADVQTAGWIDLNGVATQINGDPCTQGSNDCRVYFADNPGMFYNVYETQNLEVIKTSTSPNPHLIVK
ncbi:DUF6520 family protein [Mesonia sp. K4-1]|mgnify:CR=1 FL=1|uniref:DUF6520 family protein n=1 Tax=Mesonia sp. K4-1 TaxID=2602760 RepID=UPI0011CCB317|nr:DUF6520 family protein [Mesonia sp. K4-1]TXK74174.1 hypothetical protein FT986_11645 [Mesonia sp. K4-1]